MLDVHRNSKDGVNEFAEFKKSLYGYSSSGVDEVRAWILKMSFIDGREL